MIGRSAAFEAVVRQIQRIAKFDVPVIIEGETGTGKELAARAIHYTGPRSAMPFVPINCGALPETLIENELFGHARGAFTDARSSGIGLVRLADKGTLFLDELDALPPRAQVGLLRFLQDGRFRPLGSAGESSADVRVVAASNQSLDKLVEEGRFRQDLLFRLRVFSLRMPPLREREGDPQVLAHHFLDRWARKFGDKQLVLSASSKRWLDEQPWPGNVRELENLMLRAFLMADTGELRLDAGTASPPVKPPTIVQTNTDVAADAGEVNVGRYADARTQALARFDHAYLCQLMRVSQGNVSHAARLAGKERRALGKLLKKYEIDTAQFRR